MPTSLSLDKRFPQLAHWVRRRGWIEIGLDDRDVFGVRVLDAGGLVWEGDAADQSLDVVLQSAEDGIVVWLAEN